MPIIEMDKICKRLQNREIGVFSREPLAREVIEISDDDEPNFPR
jgi:hypothetical protein